MKTNKKFKIFTPIVASSLALVLNTNFAQAGCMSEFTSGTIPIVCAGASSGSESRKDNLLQWNATGSNFKSYIPLFNGGASDVITKLTFKFDSSGSDLQKDGSLEANSTLKAGSNVNSIVLKGNTKGIQMNKDGQGNLIVDYNQQTGKNFTLDLSDAPDGATSFAGHLKITNQKAGDNGSKNTFTATLNYDLTGSVTLSGASGENTIKLTHGSLRGNIGSGYTDTPSENKLTIDFTNSDAKPQPATANTSGRIVGDIYTRNSDQQNMTITIKGGGLQGNIRTSGENSSPSTGTLTVNFEDGAVMEGNIGHKFNVNSSGHAQGDTQKEANDFQKRVVVFKNSAPQATNTQNTEPNYVLTGNINSFGTGYTGENPDTNKGNHVTFEHGSMKGNIFASRYNYRAGYNEVIFKDANTTFFGTIRAAGSFQVSSRNVVTFEGATNTLKANENNNDVILSDGNGCDGYNNCKHDVLGFNSITFKGTTTNNTIDGNITTEAGTNNVTFEDNASSAQNNSINGAIVVMDFRDYNFDAFGGTNNITFKNHSGSNTIHDVRASKGTNNIIFAAFDNKTQEGKMEDSGLKNTIKGAILADGGINNIIFGTANKAEEVVDGKQSKISNTIAGTITANGGTNKISMNGDNTIAGTITAGLNGNQGINYFYFSGDKTTISKATDAKASDISIIAHNRDNNNTYKHNFLKLESKTNEIILKNLSALSDKWGGDRGNARNIISLESTTANTIRIDAITSTGGYNYIGKNILTQTNGNGKETNTINLTENTSGMSFTDATNAFEGVLQVGSISSSNGGWNNISYKASDKILGMVAAPEKEEENQEGKVITTQNAIIGSLALEAMTKDGEQETAPKNLLKTAISGNNNLYLDLSKNTDFADVNNLIQNEASSSQPLNQESLLPKLQAVILGNIDNKTSGTNNIKIVGGSGAATDMMKMGEAATKNDHIKLGLVGNITANGGSNNLIFENSIWLPSYIVAADTRKVANINLPKNLSGTLINNNGTTNIVLRASNPTLNNLGTSMFNVINSGNSGKVNIVVQGQVNIGANITYGGRLDGDSYIWEGKQHLGEVTLIFANSNDMNGSTKDSFDNKNTDVSGTSSKVLGVTYQDGVKLTLKDRVVSIDSQKKSFVEVYKDYFSDIADNGLLTLTTKRENQSNAQTDTITIKGLALGDISELSPSNKTREGDGQSSTTTYNYNVTLDKNSAFVGNITLQDHSNVKLTMSEGSKFLTDSKHLKIDTLTIKATNGVNTNEILLGTFAQSNTIIDIASMGNDLGDLATREDFRLLEIGKASMQEQQAEMNDKGLQGSGAIFRVYMNDSADQSKATLGNIKAQNGTQESGAESTQTDNSGQYGHLYSDRILVLSGKDSSSSSNTTSKVNYIQVLADADTKLESIKYHGGGTETKDNIAVATVKGTNDQQVAKFEGAAQIQGFDVVGTTLTTATTDQYGKIKSGMDGTGTGNDYTTYFV
ncbi:beta strand repeat-containing protein, partial [Helicobacter anatolicus]|uniref:beta strand repeat-containing protein n=1 Tax=Helicobacter anatolicus TaxID=2905874 RepID=UPI001E3F3472